MRLIGTFRTPPTPEVYEVWYRYVEAKDPVLLERVSFLVNDLGSANIEQINDLHKQFFSDDPNDEIVGTADELAGSMDDLRALIRDHSAAGERFSSTIRRADQQLIAETQPSAARLRSCVADVLASNAKMQTQLDVMGNRLSEADKQIQQLRDRLVDSQRSLMTDPLTGVGNRRSFDSLLRQAVDRPDRDLQHLFLMLIDIDQFKRINDTYGHDSGDTLIKYVAQTIQKSAPETSVTRYGGDEFAVFCSAGSPAGGKRIAEQIHASIQDSELKFARSGDSAGTISVSIGVASLRREDNADTWFAAADEMLYRAKSNGRNRVIARLN